MRKIGRFYLKSTEQDKSATEPTINLPLLFLRIHHCARLVPSPYSLFFKGDERLGRNDVKVAGQAGKGERKVGTLPDFRAAFP